MAVFNPGEVVFDQETGEPYITEGGELVEVEEGLLIDGPDGTTIQGDDVANAAWWHANLYEGEVLRDRAVGVPYQRLALGQSDPDLAAAVVIGEVRTRTPGVAGVVNVRVTIFDQATRVMRFTATLLRQGTGETVADVTVG